MNLKTPTDDTPSPSRIYQLSDLNTWEHGGTALAVLGFPIKHSVSPQMHNAALRCMAQSQLLFQDWQYYKFEIHPDDLREALGLMFEKGFRGINLTIPHKVDAVDMVARIDPHAKQMGAVNTLSNEGGDGFSGYNSDGFGLETALRRNLDVSLQGADVVLLGAGGAARAAAVQCLISGCASLWIGNRNQERLQGLLDILEPIVGEQQMLKGFDLANPPSELPSVAAIVNATSLGLKEGDPAPVDLSRFDVSSKVYDMIYNLETPLIAQAKQRGMRCADGLSMLVWQGVRSLEIWSQAAVPAQAMMTEACKTMNFAQRDA